MPSGQIHVFCANALVVAGETARFYAGEVPPYSWASLGVDVRDFEGDGSSLTISIALSHDNVNWFTCNVLNILTPAQNMWTQVASLTLTTAATAVMLAWPHYAPYVRLQITADAAGGGVISAGMTLYG